MEEKYSATKLLIEGSESFWEAPDPPENDKYIEIWRIRRSWIKESEGISIPGKEKSEKVKSAEVQ